MPPVINDTVIIESGLRLYTLHCALCGKTGITEPVTMHEMACAAGCGNTLRVIRNKHLENNREMLAAGGKPNA